MSNVMSAETYYVGDLCYVMHDAWSESCELFFNGRIDSDSSCNEGIFQLNDGRKFANFNTKYGDGRFSSTLQDFPVDSGSIGCIKLEDINLDDALNELSGGHILTFENDFEVSEENGTIYFGDLEIYTNTDEEYEPDYYSDADYHEEY